MNEIYCPPYDFGTDRQVPADATILDLAAAASAAANRYRTAMDARADLRTTFQRCRELANATQRLTTAIADAVAEGNGVTPIDITR